MKGVTKSPSFSNPPSQKWVTHAASRPSHPCYFKLNIYLSPNIELRCYVRGIWELARLWLACCRYMYEGCRLMGGFWLCPKSSLLQITAPLSGKM
ncbi:hypothetical protein XELAEV_18036773mg [Xenopus laevis]|uniref:Uncharacterized protein n=1 Tax=Xenopus laevis TaxID=8355 RepID=A0A974CB11_XENLA|nr:hypothetical protein XELAEV_18036773mg [Xenopus laevis]